MVVREGNNHAFKFEHTQDSFVYCILHAYYVFMDRQKIQDAFRRISFWPHNKHSFDAEFGMIEQLSVVSGSESKKQALLPDFFSWSKASSTPSTAVLSLSQEGDDNDASGAVLEEEEDADVVNAVQAQDEAETEQGQEEVETREYVKEIRLLDKRYLDLKRKKKQRLVCFTCNFQSVKFHCLTWK